MKKLLLTLAMALALVSPAKAVTSANSSSLTWSVSGTIFNLPGSPAAVTFRCSGTGDKTLDCYSTSRLDLNFSAPDATHVAITMAPTAVCGTPTPTCNPVPQPASVDVSSSCGAGGYTASQSFFATFNDTCGTCFGGVNQQIQVVWSASTGDCAFVATTTTTTTTLPPTLSESPDVPADNSTTLAFASLTVFPTKYICFAVPMSIGTISMYVSTNTTNGAVKECIYSADGQTKILDSTFTPSASTGTKSNSTFTAFVLPAACYYVVVGCQATCSYVAVAAPAEATSTMFGVGTPAGKTVWHGTTTHTSGTCNTTLGTVTGTASATIGFRFDQ